MSSKLPVAEEIEVVSGNDPQNGTGGKAAGKTLQRDEIYIGSQIGIFFFTRNLNCVSKSLHKSDQKT